LNLVDFKVVQPKKKKFRINYYFWGLFAVLLILFITGVYITYNSFNGPCGTTKVKSVGVAFNEVFKKWTVSYLLAAASSKDTLPSQILTLQKIEQETNEIEVPECLVSVKEDAINGMIKNIEGFMLRSNTNTSDEGINQKIFEGTSLLKKANDKLTEINQCAPDCEY
jgi:hypothetical protein